MVVVAPSGRRDYDTRAMAHLFALLRRKEHEWYPVPEAARSIFVALEAIHPFPVQGAVAAGAMMRGVGLWEGILAAYGIRVEKVSPQRWKRMMLDGRPKGKHAAILRAREVFPRADLPDGKDGRADALLLAEYARRIGWPDQ